MQHINKMQLLHTHKNYGTYPPKKITQPPTESHNLSTTKITQPLHKKSRNLSSKKLMQPLHTKNHETSPHKKSWNLQKITQPFHQKIMQPLKKSSTLVSEWENHAISPPKNHATSQQKTLPESQNAAMRTSHRLSMCQIALSKSTEKVKKNRSCEIFVWKGSMIVLTTVTTVKTVKNKMKKSFPFQYFWKEQLDTIDKRCDVLRAAFFNSCDVSVSQFDLLRLITTYVFFSFITIRFFFLQYFSF